MTYQVSEHPTREEILVSGTAVRPVFQELSTLPLFLPLVSTTGTSVSWRLDTDYQETRTVSLKTQASPLPLLVTEGSTQSQRTAHPHLELRFQVRGNDTST